MTIREKILVIEDEKSISHFISTVLNNNGYEAMQAQTGEEALSMISSHCPDLVILDLGLPDMDGLDILRSLRSWSSLPVVVVSARSHERDKVAALDLGADDYLTKPFGTDELLARVRTAIRHTRTISGNDEIARNGTYTVGELVIDYNKHQVRVRGENVHLTLSEFRIVALLGKYAGKVLTYDFIIKELWGPRASGDPPLLAQPGGGGAGHIRQLSGQPGVQPGAGVLRIHLERPRLHGPCLSCRISRRTIGNRLPPARRRTPRRCPPR